MRGHRDEVRPARLPDLEVRLRALHPYELPEFLILDAEGSPAYARWISDVAGGR